jgi:hypothetical protein
MGYFAPLTPALPLLPCSGALVFGPSFARAKLSGPLPSACPWGMPADPGQVAARTALLMDAAAINVKAPKPGSPRLLALPRLAVGHPTAPLALARQSFAAAMNHALSQARQVL